MALRRAYRERRLKEVLKKGDAWLLATNLLYMDEQK
jgi:hypothetical protein